MSTAIENTLKSKVTIVIMVLFGLLLLGCGLMSLMIYQGTSKTQKFFQGDAISSSYEELNTQTEINNKLNKIMNDKSYTLNHAYVEVNPYKNSPLSGIIIFQTKEEEQIRVYINNKYVTTMEASKKHVIPIYGLLIDTDNSVLIEGTKDTQEYILHTDKIEVDKKEALENYLFDASSNITAYDNESNVRFYLSNKYSNDIVWLSNGHYLTGISAGANNNHYIGLMEMDYLGKIYNYYILRDGYSGGVGILPNGNLITIGVVNNEYIIYTFDPRNGEVLSQIDMYGIIKGIDENFDTKYITNNVQYNSVVYKDGLLYVSNKDVIFAFDLDNKSLVKVHSYNKNIFNNPVWNNYIDDNVSAISLVEETNHKFYSEVTDNVNLTALKVINNKDKEQLSETNYKRVNLEEAKDWNNSVYFTNNIFITDYDLLNKDVNLYIVNRAGKVFILDYLDKDNNKTNRVYNLSLPVGQYVLFIEIDGELYNTHKVYQF